MPPAQHSIVTLARACGISVATVDRALANGWCPQPTLREVSTRGGKPRRWWAADAVADFIATCREAKRSGRALSVVFEEKARERPRRRRRRSPA